MTRTADELWALMAEADDMPHGTAQVALVEQVISEADALRDEHLAFHSRMIATSAYTHGGITSRAFVTFGWCLAEFDKDPERWARYQHTLLWQFKFMAGGLRQQPEVPLERINAVIDEMERRYRATGHGPHAVYAYRHKLAWHVGDLDAAQDWYEKWSITPRDALSNCVGCDPTSKAYWLAHTGRHADAIELAEQVLTGELTCSEQPQDILAAIMEPYLRTGRPAEAVDAHRRAYRRHRSNPANLWSIGEHIGFCVLTDNDTYGLEILTRHLPWLTTPPSPASAMDFAAAAGLLLRRITAAGHGGTPLTRPAFGPYEAGPTDAATLAEDLLTFAYDLAARFDARNGTRHQTETVDRTLATVPIVTGLPLTATDAAPAETPMPAPAPQPALDIPADASADELLDLADTFPWRESLVANAQIADAFDTRFGTTDLTAAQRARRADLHGYLMANSGDLAAAEIAWNSALALFAEAGDEPRRQAVRSRLGQRLCRTGDIETGLPIVVDATDYLVAYGPRDLVSGAYRRLASCYLMAHRPDDALAACDRADEHAATSRDPHAAARIAVDRSQMLAAIGRLDEARDIAAEARDRSRQDGDVGGIAGASWVVGRIAELNGDLRTALNCYDECIAVSDDPMGRRGVQKQRAMMLARTNLGGQVIDDLRELIAGRTADDTDQDVRAMRYMLGHAYLNGDRALDAADVIEKLIADSDPEDSGIESVRHLLANAYRALGQPDDAIAQLELIAASGARRGSQALIGEMNEQIAEILDQLDRDAGAAARFGLAATAYAAEDQLVQSVRCRRRHATSSLWAGDRDRAVEVLEMADRAALDLTGDEPEVVWERAMLRTDGARIIGATDDTATAIARVAPAAAAFRELDDMGSFVYATNVHADLLIRASRPADAETLVRRSMAEAAPAVRARLANALAIALDAQGREAEAADVRREYEK